MIISRTPLRISFAGGGTDLPAFYEHHGGGAVLSAAIDYYVYVLVNRKFDRDIRLSYSHMAEYVTHVDQVRHPMAREAMKATGVTEAVEIVTVSDIPAEGTGLGSSSAFAVGVLNALHAYRGQLLSPMELAEQACHIEREVLKEPGGKQDEYAAAFGGLRHYEFHPEGRVSVQPLPLSRSEMQDFADHFSLFYSGLTRSGSRILSDQQNRTAENLTALKRMREMAFETRDALLRRDFLTVGRLLDEGWQLKRQLAEGVSNAAIDSMHEKAMAAGALGAKVTGAGGGGFFLAAHPPDRAAAIETALQGFRRLPWGPAASGSQIIFVER
jgi:D-glycero-alpha-D-manno-heptose-7-phosphate kinase